MNINDSYFDGFYKDIWRAIIPAELTSKETDFMLQHFKLTPGSNVLDLMCGYGRHAIALAKQGIKVTAIDNLDEYINEVKNVAREGHLPVKAITADVLRYQPEEQFDLAICMGNSLNFFDASNVKNVLLNIHSHLRPAGHLLINTWSLAEIAIKTFAARSWNEIDGVKHICESQFLFHPTRVESQSIFLAPDGTMEKKKAIDYIFSVGEMETLLNDAGFILKEIYSIPGKKKFSLGEPRAYIVAEKA
jgi:SAM-dependent methyltransferase